MHNTVTVIKRFKHLRTLSRDVETTLLRLVFSLVFSNAHCVLLQCNLQHTSFFIH